jgi:CheY-like chemotaxis protein
LDSHGTRSRFTRNGFRVLVVDDKKDAADSLYMLLRAWGYDCRVAYDGVAGLAMASDYGPDCLFLEIAMPGMDGYKLARKVRSYPGLNPVRLVALIAYSNEPDVQRLREAGFDFLLTKTTRPSEIERLMEMISKVVWYTGMSEQMNRHNVKESKDEVREIKEASTVDHQGSSAS